MERGKSESVTVFAKSKSMENTLIGMVMSFIETCDRNWQHTNYMPSNVIP